MVPVNSVGQHERLNILALSDAVDERVYSERILDNYSDVDMVIGCGDLPYDYLEYVVTLLNQPLLYVHGNHDPILQIRADGRWVRGAEGCMLIDGRIVMESDCIFMGLGGSIRYRPDAPFQYTESEMRARVLRLLPRLMLNRLRHGRYLDVLVTHSPPHGVHDRLDQAHIGFKVFLDVIRIFKPRMLLHGHTHSSKRQRSFIHGTQVIGVYPVCKIDLPECGPS